MKDADSLSLRQVLFLLFTIACLICIPFITLYVLMDGHIPPDLFDYPPTTPPPSGKPGMNLISILVCLLIVSPIILIYIYPKIFGFKKKEEVPENILTKKYLPVWFWVGLIMFGSVLFLFSIQASEPKWILNWGLIPLFWGFILFLDGILFYINDGVSLLSKSPTELIALGAVSISGWLYFDYLNFFIEQNWFYPKASLISEDKNIFFMYAVIGSSGFIPMAFEWYFLLRKVKVFNTKYKHGPKINTPKWLLYAILILSGFLLVELVRYPDTLYCLVWVAPLMMLASILAILGIWTPFTPIKEGDWTAFLVFALTFLIQGIFLEMWNYMSAHHIDGKLETTYNCAYWIYCVPYVNDVCKIFEMPFFGYFGYLFFSIHCYLWWVLLSNLLGISSKFVNLPEFK